MSIPLYLLTFNCGKLKLHAESFSDDLAPHLPATPPALFVFGFQELCSILDASFPETVQKHAVAANSLLLRALHAKYCSGPGASYNFTTLGVQHTGAVAIVAITPFRLRFSNCRFASAACGAGFSLLKGAAGIRVQYSDNDGATELTFALAHLAAAEGEAFYQRRHDDIHKLMRALDFGDGYSFLKPGSHSFFMGDLNFRTTRDLRTAQAAMGTLLELQDTSSDAKPVDIGQVVAQLDELSHGRADGELFACFDEAPITFRPTYKYHLNTAIYNTKRCPLWCDRVLYQATYRGRAKPEIHSYNSILSCLVSDHRPVYLHISVPFEAPESILARNGYLLILPLESHLGDTDHDIQLASVRNNVSGPTQDYMKMTAADTVQQKYLRRAADLAIGYTLWFGTTSRGRVLLLFSLFLVALVAWR